MSRKATTTNLSLLAQSIKKLLSSKLCLVQKPDTQHPPCRIIVHHGIVNFVAAKNEIENEKFHLIRVQNQDGGFVFEKGGAVPHETEIPGTIRYALMKKYKLFLSTN